uniref:Uncharacterized protein n=1 Tax=Arundo donax TaxID=35708 RepID=A0A0A9DGH6_ARUDO
MKTIMHMHPSSTGYSEFVEPDDVSTECIKISLPLLHQFRPRTLIQHKDIPLQICCSGLKVRFGVRPTFLSNSGRPKLNIVVDIPENLGKVLQFCDDLAQRSSPESHDTSEWRPLIKKYGNVNRPTVRLNIPTVISGDTAIYSTDIQKKERNGTVQELVFSKIDAAELNSLIRGQLVDAFFSLEMYDYQQNAGIRLVANRLVIHSE